MKEPYRQKVQAEHERYRSIWDEKTVGGAKEVTQKQASFSKKLLSRFAPTTFRKSTPAPQAIIKIAHTAKSTGSTLMNYMLDENKEQEHEGELPHKELHQKIYTDDGETLKNKEEIQQWIKENKPKSTRKNATGYTHLILSAKTIQKNADTVLFAAEETLSKHFGQFGFRYAYSLDTNTDNPHVHVMLYNTNPMGDQSVRLWKPQVHALRQTFAQELTAMGIEHRATLSQARNKSHEVILERNELVQQLLKSQNKQEEALGDLGSAKERTNAILMKVIDNKDNFDLIRQAIATPPTKEQIQQWIKEYTARKSVSNSFWKTRTTQEKQELQETNANQVTPTEQEKSEYLLWNKERSNKITKQFGSKGRSLYASLLKQGEAATKENKKQHRDFIADKIIELTKATTESFNKINKDNQVRIYKKGAFKKKVIAKSRSGKKNSGIEI